MSSPAGRLDELKETLLALVGPTRNEPGNIYYNIHQSEDEPNNWMIYEGWRSVEDFEKHLEMPYIKSFFAKEGVLFNDIKVVSYRMVSPL